MAERVLELRVHGVSNKSPADILGLPPQPGDPQPGDPQPPTIDRPGEAGTETDPPRPQLVAGDAMTGFYRSSQPDADDPVTVEAYSWGQLTSGARTAKDIERALWTMLLPFTLANLALHARPDIPVDPRRERWTSRGGLTAWLVRLFCLSLTATLVLSATGFGVDLVAWQCVDDECLGRIPGSWRFLGDGWWAQGARALTIGLIVPLGLLLVMGALTWRTYQYEADMPTTGGATPDDAAPADPVDGGPTEPGNPLQDPTFWCGEGQVRRCAVLHLATGAAVAAAVPLGAVLAMDPPVGGRAALAWPTVAALAAAVLLAVGALGHPYVTRRGGDTPLGGYAALVAGLALVGVAGTIAMLLLPDGPAGVPLERLRPPDGCGRDATIPGCLEDRSLPGYDRVLAAVGACQILLLVAIAAVSRHGRAALAVPLGAAVAIGVGALWIGGLLPAAAPAGLRTWMLVSAVIGAAAVLVLALPRCDPSTGADPLTCVAWGGRGPAVLAGLGLLFGISYSAGVLYWATDWLANGAGALGLSPVAPPLPVMWAGLAFLAALIAVAVVAGRAWFVFTGLRRGRLAALTAPDAGLSAHERRRARDVATVQALHILVGEHAVRLVGQLTAAALVLAAAAAALALSHTRPTPADPHGWLVVVQGAAEIGGKALGLLPVAVSALGMLVYRNDAVRRSIGVIWDIGTFWPRSAHPLAPPSYAERAVPQLETRTCGLLALPADDPRRASAIILSGHSQGAVIAAAVVLQLPQRWRRQVWLFSYGCQLSRLYGRVFPAYFGPRRLPAVAAALRTPTGQVRWTNFWRDTDPLGWSISAGQRDIAVRDPTALHPTGGEVTDPPLRGHGGYPDAEEFQLERRLVTNFFARPSAGTPAGPVNPAGSADRAGPAGSPDRAGPVNPAGSADRAGPADPAGRASIGPDPAPTRPPGV